MTAYTETADGLMLPRGPRPTTGADRYDALLALYESRLLDLERQLAEDGWQRLAGNGAREFSRSTLDNIVDLSRVHVLKNPLIRRIVEVGKLYVWGQDLSVDADEAVKPVIERFDRDNAATLCGQLASGMLDIELRTTGNLFLAFFPNRADGSLRVRQVPVEEIRAIATNPDDRAEVQFFRREWAQKQPGGGTTVAKAYHPHIDYQPATKPASLPGEAGDEIEVRWDAPMDHVKVGGFPHWTWGVPEVYAALDWARAYKEQLEDDATRSKALARFAWKMTTGGGSAGVAAAKTRFGTTYPGDGLGTPETNPPPAAGGLFLRANTAQDLEPMRIAGATLDPLHSRPARLMVAAAAGLPDTTLSGDVDQSSLATSQSMDRPTHLQFSEDRAMWVEKRQRWYRYAIETDAAATGGLLRGMRPTEEQLTVKCSFPDLLEPDSQVRIQTIAAAAPYLAEETAARLVLAAIGVEDVDGELAKWQTEQADKAKMAAQIAKQTLPNGPGTPQGPPSGNQPPSNGNAPQGPQESMTEGKTPKVVVTDADLADANAWWDSRFGALKGALATPKGDA